MLCDGERHQQLYGSLRTTSQGTFQQVLHRELRTCVQDAIDAMRQEVVELIQQCGENLRCVEPQAG